MGQQSISQGLVILIIVSLFYSFAITVLTYAMPASALVYTDVFSNADTTLNLNATAQQFQDSLANQRNIPVIELGALVFYSGNILLDLLLNFVFAVPQMLNLLIQTFGLLFGFDPVLGAYLQIFTTVLLTVLYIFGLITMLMGIRSGNLSGVL